MFPAKRFVVECMPMGGTDTFTVVKTFQKNALNYTYAKFFGRECRAIRVRMQERD